MGIFSAMTTAVTGLRAQSFALDNISGNIANAQTIGFKRNDTTFADLVADDGAAPTQRSGSVRALTQSTNGVAGGIQSSDIATNMSINGNGYFVLAQKTGSANGNPIFSTESLYTRRGDFALDKDGYLVNGAGYYLKAQPIDQTTGERTVLWRRNDCLRITPAEITPEQITCAGGIPLLASPGEHTRPIEWQAVGQNPDALLTSGEGLAEAFNVDAF